MSSNGRDPRVEVGENDEEAAARHHKDPFKDLRDRPGIVVRDVQVHRPGRRR